MVKKEVKKVTKKTESASGGLLDEVMELTRLKDTDEGYDIAKLGVQTFLKELLKPDKDVEKVDKKLVMSMIDEIDVVLGKQMDEILHNEKFQEIESAWSSLNMMVRKTDFKENIKIQILDTTKENLIDDFDEAADVTKSGLYQHMYTQEYGQYGGEPVAAMIANYEFTPGSQDVKLMRDVSSIGAMSHAPFIASASPEFFTVDSYDDLQSIKDIESIFDGPQYAKWRGFRESDDSRNFSLALPNFMLRSVYNEDNPVKSFNYVEKTDGKSENYLWGNAAFALGTRLTDSFAKYRWCPNIIGPQSGGAVLDLPIDFNKDNGQQVIGPTEAGLSDRREFELAELGFIPLTMKKGADNATFFSANSVQKTKFYGADSEGKQAELNYRLGTQLPYLFIVNRLAHYIKVLQRENLGSWKSRNDLDRELNRWIRQYVSDQENPSPDVRSKRPLRSAEIIVSDVEGEAGWYHVEMKVTPHFKFMGAYFTLFLEGKLDLV
ncbi:MAG: type VI secretion system contractile sheath large subunit [Deltaproteobacteria bacterium]|nr:type VI secretion system contractile sheath large subunit [Deltaproteobacteria bacterium]